MINKRPSSNYIANVKLSKILGVYQMLDQNSPTVFGYNVYQWITIVVGLSLPIVCVLIMTGIYYWIENPAHISYHILLLVNLLLSFYKIYIMINQSDVIWTFFLEIGTTDFLSNGRYDRDIFKRTRWISIWATNMFVFLIYFSTSLWSLIPLSFKTTKYLTLKNIDGTYSNYRYNIFNLYFMVSSETYNKYYKQFYFIELFVIVIVSHALVMFDTFLISTCLSISCQLQLLVSGLDSTKRKWIENNADNTLRPNKNSTILHDLNKFISDYEKVTTVIYKFYQTIQSVVLMQICIASYSLIFLTYVVISNIKNSEFGEPIQAIKMLSTIPAFMFQLCIVCYLYGNINIQKEAINFSLYCSDWTEMNLECKQLILMAMRWNDSKQLRMRISPTKTVNMEMCANVINLCYSVLSVLIKHNTKNLDQ